MRGVVLLFCVTVLALLFAPGLMAAGAADVRAGYVFVEPQDYGQGNFDEPLCLISVSIAEAALVTLGDGRARFVLAVQDYYCILGNTQSLYYEGPWADDSGCLQALDGGYACLDFAYEISDDVLGAKVYDVEVYRPLIGTFTGRAVLHDGGIA